MRYWLMKSEPEAYSWDDLVRDKRGRWDGVRNHAAAANLRAARKGDLAIFYHSDDGKEAVGIMKVVRIAYLDPTAKTAEEKMADKRKGNWVAIDVAPVKALKRRVTLAEMKTDPVLKGMKTVKQGRLSVAPVTAAEWKRLLALAGLPMNAWPGTSS